MSTKAKFNVVLIAYGGPDWSFKGVGNLIGTTARHLKGSVLYPGRVCQDLTQLNVSAPL